MVPIVDGFPPPNFQTGEEWFKKQPPAVQKEMMGPGRYKAWQDGRFQFSQLATVTEHPIWGPNAQVTSLADLVKGTGGPGAGNGARPAPPVEIAPPEPPKRPPAQEARERLTATAERFSASLTEAEAGVVNAQTRFNAAMTRRGEFIASSRGLKAAKARPEWAEIEGEIAAATDSVMGARARLADVSQAQTDALRSSLHVDNPAKIKVEYASKFAKSDARQAAVETGAAEFGRLVDASLVRFPLAVKKGGSGRSFFSPVSNDINMTTSAGVATVVHEMGHWLEHNNETVRRAVREFYRARTEGESVVDLRRATGNVNYRGDERTRVDRFIEPYMGKVYSNRDGEIYATEILSMGLELFYKSPARLAAEDPEYFDFIYNVVRGL